MPVLTLLFALAHGAPTTWQPAPPAVADALENARSRKLFVDPIEQRWVIEVSAPALGVLDDPDRITVAGVTLDPHRHLPAGLGGEDRVEIWPREGAPFEVPLPAAEGWIDPQLSRDGAQLYLTRVTSEGLALWQLDTGDWTLSQLTQPVLHRATGPACVPLSPGEGLLCKIAPTARGKNRRLEHGPVIRGEGAPEAPTRSSASAAERVRWHLGSQLVWLRPDLQVAPLGDPRIWGTLSPSPDDSWVLAECWQGPFVEGDELTSLPIEVEILDRRGRTAAQVGRRTPVPAVVMGTVPAGPRALQWRPDEPAELVWTEALDGGDPTNTGELREALTSWRAPFTRRPEVLWRGTRRYGGLSWAPPFALVTEWWWQDRSLLTWRLSPDESSATGVLLEQTTGEDVGANWLVGSDGQVLRSRTGAAWRRRRTTLDQQGGFELVALDSGKVQARRPVRDGTQPVLLLDNEGESWVEAAPDGSWWVRRGRRAPTAWVGAVSKLEPAAQSLGDGVGRLYAAIGERRGPVLLWLVEGSGGGPTRGASVRWLVHAGIDVIELPMAALDRLDEALAQAREQGADGGVVVGGHGETASAALELAASREDLLAVVARSGRYRTEEGRLQPWLDQVDAPVLFVHGGQDRRHGFGVAQAQVAYELVQRRTTARWVELPDEDHGYRRRPSVEHVLWEIDAWLARWASATGGEPGSPR